MFVLPKTGKSGQKTISFDHFSKSDKWHYTKYRTFKHPQISNQAISHKINI